jgi:hypothetical protein
LSLKELHYIGKRHTMYSLDTDDAAERLEGNAPPCISLYQPTHRHHPGEPAGSDSISEPCEGA